MPSTDSMTDKNSITMEEFLFPFEPTNTEKTEKSQPNSNKSPNWVLNNFFSDIDIDDVNKQDIQKAKYAIGGLKHVTSILAHGVDLPAGILNIAQLKNMESIYDTMSQSESIRQIFPSISNETEKQQPNSGWLKKLSDSVMNYITPISQAVGEKIVKLSQEETMIGKIEEEVSKLSKELDKNIELSPKTFTCDIQPTLLKCFIQLYAYIEREIWQTPTASARPFYHLFRQSKIWRLLTLLWFYNQTDNIKKSADSNAKLVERTSLTNIMNHKELIKINYLGMPEVFIIPITLKDNTVLVIGPCLKTEEQQKFNHLHDFYIAHGYKMHLHYKLTLEYCEEWLKEFFKQGELSVSEQMIGNLCTPDNNEIFESLIFRIPYQYKEVAIRTNELTKAFKLLLQTKIQPDSVSYDLRERIALYSLWSVRYFKSICNASWKQLKETYLAENYISDITKSKPNCCLWIKFNTGKKNTPILITLQKTEGTPNSDLGLDKLINDINCNRDTIIEFPNVFLNHLKSRMALSTSIQIRALGNAINSFFGHKEDDHNHIFQRVGAYISEQILNLTHGEFCSFYLLKFNTPKEEFAHPNLDYVQEDGFYTYYQGIHVKKEAYLEALNQGREQPMPELGTDGKPLLQSSVFRCIQLKQSLLINQTDETNALLDYYPKNLTPQSILAVPMLFNGRVLGMIQVRSMFPEYFSEFDLMTLTRVSQLISPYFYQYQLISSLKAITEEIGNQKKAGKEETNLNKITSYLNTIFLTSNCHIWLKSKGQSDSFELKGYSNEIGLKRIDSKVDQHEFNIDTANLRQPYQPSLPFVQTLSLPQQWCLQNREIILSNKVLQHFVIGTSTKKVAKISNISKNSEYSEYKLGRDYLNNNDRIVRSDLAEKYPEQLALAITQKMDWRDFNGMQRESDLNHRIIGFLVLFHQYKHSWNSEWGNILNLVNETISIALDHLELIETPKIIASTIASHEISQRTSYLQGAFIKHLKRNHFFNDQIQKLCACQPLMEEIKQVREGDKGKTAFITQLYNRLQPQEQGIVFDFLESFISNRILFRESPNAMLKAIEDLDSKQKQLNAIIEGKQHDVIQIDRIKIAEIYLDDLAKMVYQGYKAKFIIQEKYLTIDDGQCIDPVYMIEADMIAILENLFDNARKYSLQYYPIKLEIRTTHLQKKLIFSNVGKCSLKVLNSGDILIEPGYTTNNDGGSKGYGLYIIDNLCKRHGFKFDYTVKQLFDASSYLKKTLKAGEILAKYQFNITF